jgi:hypothetical protein
MRNGVNLWRPIRMRIGRLLLSKGNKGQRGNNCRRQHRRTELESLRHFNFVLRFLASLLPCFITSLLRFLHLLLLRFRSFVCTYWRRQALQRLEILQHVMIFQHRKILHHLRIRFLGIAPGQLRSGWA